MRGLDYKTFIKNLKSKFYKKIVTFCGAGISQAAGIPDFRSSSGLYAQLEKQGIYYPEQIFDIQLFRTNPSVFYKFAHMLYYENAKPTLTHVISFIQKFIAQLEKNNQLLLCATQNIDMLERKAGITKLVEMHGTFASSSCTECHTSYNQNSMVLHIKNQTIPKCDKCGGVPKPNIVFFGEALPQSFYNCVPIIEQETDLLIVLGTSLQVYPAAGIVQMVKENVPKVLINKEKVGNLTGQNDLTLLGDCEITVKKILEDCEWNVQEIQYN